MTIYSEWWCTLKTEPRYRCSKRFISEQNYHKTSGVLLESLGIFRDSQHFFYRGFFIVSFELDLRFLIEANKLYAFNKVKMDENDVDSTRVKFNFVLI